MTTDTSRRSLGQSATGQGEACGRSSATPASRAAKASATAGRSGPPACRRGPPCPRARRPGPGAARRRGPIQPARLVQQPVENRLGPARHDHLQRPELADRTPRPTPGLSTAKALRAAVVRAGTVMAAADQVEDHQPRQALQAQDAAAVVKAAMLACAGRLSWNRPSRPPRSTSIATRARVASTLTSPPPGRAKTVVQGLGLGGLDGLQGGQALGRRAGLHPEAQQLLDGRSGASTRGSPSASGRRSGPRPTCRGARGLRSRSRPPALDQLGHVGLEGQQQVLPPGRATKAELKARSIFLTRATPRTPSASSGSSVRPRATRRSGRPSRVTTPTVSPMPL
jgi:hypothetical protein